MARDNYDLQTIRDGTIISSNETTYTVNLLIADTGSGVDMIFDSSGVEISYECQNDKDKNSSILTSKCTVPFLVQDATDEALIASLSTTYKEKDVWITIREGTNLLWCGYVLLDLKTEQDISFPYTVTLTAVDGLAGLKDVPFVREENISTSAVPSFPYVEDDTFFNAGFNKIIGSGTTIRWLSDLIYRTGMLLAADDTGGTTFLEDYTIQTAVNFYNDGHPAPATNIDPLFYTKINIKILHSLTPEGFVDVPDCYTVLEYICKNFGMRCIYWQHTFHFIQLNEYNTDEDGAGTISAPINIPTRLYYYTGSIASGSPHNYIGSNKLSIYNLELENSSAPAEGLQKLSGAIYSGLPPIKTVNGLYFSALGNNAYAGIPLFPTFPTTGISTTIVRYSDGMQLTEAASGTGLNLKFYLSFKNTASQNLLFRTMLLLRARPTGETNWNNAKVLKRVGGIYEWVAWTTGSQPFSGTDAISRWAKASCWIPPSPTIDQNVGILAYDSASDPWSNSSGLIPIDSAFSGDWTFYIVTWTMWEDDHTYPMRGWDGTDGHPDYGGTSNHGQIKTLWNGTGTNYSGNPLEKWKAPSWYAYDYANTLNPNSGSSVPFSGIFRAESTTSELEIPFTLETTIENTNSFIYDAGDFFWGDGETMQVSDDNSTWVFPDVDGEWTAPTYVWNNGTSQFDYTVGSYNKKLIQLVVNNIIYNQSIALNQFNGTTALSETNKYYSGTTTLKYMNPIGKLKDVGGKEYTLMRGTFNLVLDQWDVTLNEVFYEIPSEAINSGVSELPAGEIEILGL